MFSYACLVSGPLGLSAGLAASSYAHKTNDTPVLLTGGLNKFPARRPHIHFALGLITFTLPVLMIVIKALQPSVVEIWLIFVYVLFNEVPEY